MQFDIIAIGHLINETIVFPGKEARSVLGSPPAYSMACASSIGARVGIVSIIGSDYPKRLLEPLERLGVDLTGLQTKGEYSTNNLLTYDANGSKVIQYLSRAWEIVPEDIPKNYKSAKLIYVCPMDWEVSADSVEKLAAFDGLLACDLGGFGGAHSAPGHLPQMVRDAKSVERVIAACDIVKASDEDCWRLTGDVGLNLEQFARTWIKWGAKISIITLGSKGSLIATTNNYYEIRPIPGKPIDATGGGDSYMGGFLVHFIRTHDPLAAGIYGAATALHVIEGTGGVTPSRMPSTEAVELRLRDSNFYHN